MRACTSSGIPDITDEISSLNHIPLLDGCSQEVTVPTRHPISVIYLDHVSHIAIISYLAN